MPGAATYRKRVRYVGVGAAAESPAPAPLPAARGGITNEVRCYTHVISRQDVDLDSPLLFSFVLEHSTRATSIPVALIRCFRALAPSP